MRARICSALSCDMFARVVWLRLRRARDSRLSLCHLPHALATHYFLRLTRARGVSSQREGNALFADFWYFWSRKSTIKEKWLYLKKTPHPSAYGCHLLPQSRRRRPRLLRKSVNSPLEKAGKMSWFRQRTCQTHARLALSAGVQTMRARICSTSSCAMFARVGT